MLPLLVFLTCTLRCVAALELQLYSCPGDPALVRCVAEQASYLEWEIRAGLDVLGSSRQPADGNTTIESIQIISSSTPSADDPQMLDIQSTLTFNPTQVPQGIIFHCSAMRGGLSSSSLITYSHSTSDVVLHMNYTVTEYRQDVVVATVTWEPEQDDTVYIIKAIPGNTEDTITQEMNSPPAHFNLRYNTDYNLTVQETMCSDFVSTKFFQPGCYMPVAPENGELDRFVSSHVGANITYQCPSGTSVDATCSQDLEWVPAPSELSCKESNPGNCGTLKAMKNIKLLNNTDPHNVLLTCVDGFEPEEEIQVQCINGTWHPDPATINCTEKLLPSEESESDIILLIIITVAVVCVLLLLCALLTSMLLLAWFRKKAIKRKHRQREKGLDKVGTEQEATSPNQQCTSPQDGDTDGDTDGSLQLQKNDAYGTSTNYITGRQHMAVMMTINAAYGSVAGNGQSNAVHNMVQMAHELDEENEEYHYYY